MSLENQNQVPSKPNFLFIMADQFRHDHLGILKAHPVDTPNLDKLAQSGTCFTQCITNAPVCSPARISLATGLHALHSGALENSAYCSLKSPTYYQRLRDADYHVSAIGKFDLAKDKFDNGNGKRPANYRWGFTDPLEIEGKYHAGIGFPEIHGPYSRMLATRGLLEAFRDDYSARQKSGWATSCEDSVLPSDAFADCYIGQEAVKWLQTAEKDYPWHLFVSFVGPHDPFDPPTEYADMFRTTEVPPAIKDQSQTRPDYITKRQKDFDGLLIEQTRRQYIASIKAIDDQIGDILKALKERGEENNTYIIFTSDHGEMLGDLGLYTKSVPYEASIRVPLLVAGPGVPSNRRSEALIEMSDLNPSICELAGLKAQHSIDAQSFVAVIKGEQDKHRSECLSMLETFRLLRSETHKYVAHINAEPELFDLRVDPMEQNNLAKTQATLVQQFAKRMRTRLWSEAGPHY